MTPPIDLDAIRARLAAATPGPWEAGETHHYHEGTYHERYTEVEPNIAAGLRPADADLIAHAPEDLRLLVDEVERLRAVAEAATAFIAAWEREADNIHTAADLHAALDALNAGGEGK